VSGSDIIDALIFISQRPIVITLAIVGALFVTAGSLMVKPEPRRAPGQGGRFQEPAAPPVENTAPPDLRTQLAGYLTRSGYAITMFSIALFIVAGFVSDLRP